MKPVIVLIVFCIVAIKETKSADLFNIDGSNYYSSYPDKLNWHQALRFCTYNGMYLVDVRTDFENQRIMSVIQRVYAKHKVSQLFFWTSGTDLGSEGQFYWASTGHPMLYTYWGGIEPNGGTVHENCVHYWGAQNHTWNDADCASKFNFICRDTFDVPVYKNWGCDKLGHDTF